MAAKKQSDKPARGRGRPREFDRHEAMMRAMPLFWDRGYEGTSIADLVSAMGITPPALYSAYGSKEELYRELLDLYISERAGFDPTLYFGERTTHETLSRILREAANAFTAPNHPKGCMISTAALANAPEHSEIAAHLATLRNAMRKALEGRLEAARAAGHLPEHADPNNLILCQPLRRCHFSRLPFWRSFSEKNVCSTSL